MQDLSWILQVAIPLKSQDLSSFWRPTQEHPWRNITLIFISPWPQLWFWWLVGLELQMHLLTPDVWLTPVANILWLAYSWLVNRLQMWSDIDSNLQVCRVIPSAMFHTIPDLGKRSCDRMHNQLAQLSCYSLPLFTLEHFLHLSPVSLHRNVALKRLTRCFFIVVLDEINAAPVWCVYFLTGHARTSSLTWSTVFLVT